MKKLLLAAAAVAALTTPLSAKTKGEVLVIVSSEHHLNLADGKKYATGYYLNELAVPVQKIIEAGYTPIFANPKGNKPSMDVHSNDKMFFGGDDTKRSKTLAFVDSLPGLAKPKSFETVLKEGTDRYVGIFLPGGHAPMQDLLKSQDLGKILKSFHDSQRPTALICHAPIALLSTMADPVAFHEAAAKNDTASMAKLAANWPYAGYRMTVFATSEEKAVEPGQLKGKVRFYPAEVLAEAGGRLESLAAWKSNVVQDRELITGQQPFSDDALGDLFVKALDIETAKRK